MSNVPFFGIMASKVPIVPIEHKYYKLFINVTEWKIQEGDCFKNNKHGVTCIMNSEKSFL